MIDRIMNNDSVNNQNSRSALTALYRLNIMNAYNTYDIFTLRKTLNFQYLSVHRPT